MTSSSLPKSLLLFGFPALFAILAGCSTGGPIASLARKKTSFEEVRPILESSCVHCHGVIRLPNMPSFNSTKALASLTGPGKLIVPGAPESSRFYQVMMLSDGEVGAMPPTGHALKPKDIAIIRQWIAEGAIYPQENITLAPEGESPRSR